MVQEILCLIAGQRSGTTALRDLIAGTSRFADLAEIFDTATIDQPTSYFGYCRERDLKITDILSGPDTERLCKDYIEVLRKAAGDKHLLIDVKFNSWGEIRMPWTYMHQEPFFLSQLKWMKAKFLFIWRRDIADQVLSDRISDHLGKWHNLAPEDVAGKFSLNVEMIRRRSRLLCQSEQYFYRIMRHYGDVKFICYDDLFNQTNSLNKAARDEISALMGEKYIFPNVGFYHRNGVAKSEILDNYATLVAAVTEVVAEYRDPELIKMSR